MRGDDKGSSIGPTVVELLESPLGSEVWRPERVDGLTAAQIEGLEDLTNAFYRDTSPSSPKKGSYGT